MRLLVCSCVLAGFLIGCGGDDRPSGDGIGGEGEPCPCDPGLVCDAEIGTCGPEEADAGTGSDAGGEDAGPTDAAPTDALPRDSGTTAGAADCDGWCTRAGAAGCTNFEMSTCLSDCRMDEAASTTAGCAAEYEALVDCLATATYTCDGSDEPATADCEPEAEAWVSCTP